MLASSLTFSESLLMRSWWVILFALVCGIGYEQGLKKMRQDKIKLHHQLERLEEEYQLALEKNQELQLQINSQSDPDFIQLTLMKGLGVVPEGQTKAFFHQKESL